ncbi:MAG: type I glyceraldehyde-3-phosphate dehydrogenase [Patescibacteria group bacterium]|jgi:glyceraldehyde 3-phosphate dehydrogenase
MALKVAINGFGRVGRAAFRVAHGNKGLNIVAINDTTDTETHAHLLKYDSVYGKAPFSVSFNENEIVVDGVPCKVFTEKDPAKLPWKELGIDIVLECTGRFTRDDAAKAHLAAGAKRVVVSAPTKGGDTKTYLLGVNDETYSGDAIVSNASCTTNCVAPVTTVIEDVFGIKKAVITTVHSYTAEQNLVDGSTPPLHKDLRRARAAAINIIPTTTGAAVSTTEVIPELKGKFDGLALRVPLPVGSLTDFTFLLNRPTTKEEVNEAFRKAAEQERWKGILAVTDEALVSSNIVGNSHSAIVDLGLTMVVDGDLLKVIAWYDNEWGYVNRLVEMAELVGKTIR